MTEIVVSVFATELEFLQAYERAAAAAHRAGDEKQRDRFRLLAKITRDGMTRQFDAVRSRRYGRRK